MPWACCHRPSQRSPPPRAGASPDAVAFGCAGFHKFRNRVSDFRLLTVGDVQSTNGNIRSRVVTAQRKVSRAKRCQPVEVDVPQRARDALAKMIAAERKTATDFLFTHPSRPHGEPLCRKQLGRLVKSWVTEIGMDTHRIACHTMRRTRPTISIRKGTASLVQRQALARAQGHQRDRWVRRYRGGRRVAGECAMCAVMRCSEQVRDP
jgi:integrase-like protein